MILMMNHMMTTITIVIMIMMMTMTTTMVMGMDMDMMNLMMMIMIMHCMTVIGIMTTNRMMMMKTMDMVHMVAMVPLVITGTTMTKRKMPFLLQIYKMNGWMNKMVPHGLSRKMQCRITICNGRMMRNGMKWHRKLRHLEVT